MNTPRETKVYVSFWLALSALWLAILVANLLKGDWSGALDSFASASLTGYVALLIHGRDKAQRFRRDFISAVRNGGWSA